jgi:hypothetical protein
MFLSGLDSCIDFQVFMPNHNHFNGPGTSHSQSSHNRRRVLCYSSSPSR